MDFSVQAPEKNGYKFNEVTSLTGVKPYVLRFWETEFHQINPNVGESGQKLYNKRDLMVVKIIKRLLFEQKLSIPEAQNILDQEIAAVSIASPDEEQESPGDIGSSDMKGQSLELKKALEEIVTVGKEPGEKETNKTSKEQELTCKASSLASRFKREVKVHNRSLSEADIVNLVSAKKKLTKLLGTIEELDKKRGWKL
ncbi:MAG: MerR family transcriptional regulator [Bacteriovoracaceae bacterium]